MAMLFSFLMTTLFSFLYDGTAASPIIQLDLLSPLLGSTWSRSEQLRCENPERIENCDRL